MMWFFKRKAIQKLHEQKESEAERINAETHRRTSKARKPMERLVQRLEDNNLTLQIRKGMGNRNV